MCEFRVSVSSAEKDEVVAEDVVSAKLEKDEMLLYDVLGSVKRVRSTIIKELDVAKEAMVLEEVPMLAQLLSFLEAYRFCLKNGKYTDEVEKRWEELKALGDEMIKSLWRMYGRSP